MSNDTPQDARIRALMVELSESSPLAPTAEELGLSTRPVTVHENEALPSYTEVSSMVVKDNTKGRRVFAGLAATITMVLGGSLAFNAANDGGKANPEAAVEQLLNAMADEDALGMIESIDPDERRAITPHIDDLVAELERVELLEGTDTEAVTGFDFSFDGVELASRQLGDGIWAIRLVEGTFTSSTNNSALPLGQGPLGTEDVSNFALNLDEWVASWPELFAAEDFEMVVTNDDGWHVNVVYTFMEQIRKDEGWPEPDYSVAIDPAGAASPQEAAEAWITAQGNWDVPAIIDLLDPVEMPAVHRYADQLRSAVEDGDPEFLYAPDSTITFDQVRVDGGGPERTVVVEQFTVTQRYEGSSGLEGDSFESVVMFDGVCRSILSDAEQPSSFSQESCLDTEDLDAPSIAVVAATPVEIRVVERDGAWFVSPAGTVVDQALDGLRVRNADGFDADTVFVTLFEIPVLPFYVPGGATGILSTDTEMFDDSFFECEGILERGVTTEEEAAEAADDYSACIVENDIDPTLMGDRTAEISCSHVFSPYDELDMTLEEALAVSDEFGACVTAKGGDPVVASIVGDVYCSNNESEAEWRACTEQFGIELPVIPEICEPVFATMEDNVLSEAEFEALIEENPECFGE